MMCLQRGSQKQQDGWRNRKVLPPRSPACFNLLTHLIGIAHGTFILPHSSNTMRANLVSFGKLRFFSLEDYAKGEIILMASWLQQTCLARLAFVPNPSACGMLKNFVKFQSHGGLENETEKVHRRTDSVCVSARRAWDTTRKDLTQNRYYSADLLPLEEKICRYGRCRGSSFETLEEENGKLKQLVADLS